MAFWSEIRFAPPAAAMQAFIEPHRPWIESVLNCKMADSVTCELEVPLDQVVVEDILQGVVLDCQCLPGADAFRSLVSRWELPPGVSPRIELVLSRAEGSLITAKKLAWDPHWKETPVAVWMKGLRHPLVVASIPYVSLAEGIRDKWADWLIVNRAEIAAALTLLGDVLARPPKRITVMGGRDIPIPAGVSGWDSLVLDAQALQLVRSDFEFFFQREAWFREFHLPYRRGYLLYGLPGNGKTSVVRAMASHPQVRAFSLDFSNEELHNDALTELFEAAYHAAPSLVIFEDLERLYGSQDEQQNRTRITLQHLLNSLDGLGSRDGIIVAATANRPETLDPAILRRPGRFDRVVPLLPPPLALRQEYISKLTCGGIDSSAVAAAVAQSDGFSFAQIREAYIVAGQFAFSRGDDGVGGDDLLQGVRIVRHGPSGTGGRLGQREAGFVSALTSS